MTKAEFFRYCDQSTMPVKVYTGNIYREMEKAVFLGGLWNRGSMTSVQLYQPTPGRQWPQRHTRDAALEKAEAKFQRWLNEWKAAGSPSKLKQGL